MKKLGHGGTRPPMAERKLKPIVWLPITARSMARAECGSTTTVCTKCHASIQATVKKAHGWRKWKQQEMKL